MSVSVIFMISGAMELEAETQTQTFEKILDIEKSIMNMTSIIGIYKFIFCH